MTPDEQLEASTRHTTTQAGTLGGGGYNTSHEITAAGELHKTMDRDTTSEFTNSQVAPATFGLK